MVYRGTKLSSYFKIVKSVNAAPHALVLPNWGLFLAKLALLFTDEQFGNFYSLRPALLNKRVVVLRMAFRDFREQGPRG